MFCFSSGGGGSTDCAPQLEVTFVCTDCYRGYTNWDDYSAAVCGNGDYGLEIVLSFAPTPFCKTTVNPCAPVGSIGILLPGTSLGFTKFLNSLPPNLQTIIQASANINFYNMLSDYYLANGSSQETKYFITWAVQFLSDNPGVTALEFENWFIDGNILSATEMADFISDLNSPDLVKPTRRFKNNVRLNCIFNKAKTSSNFNQYLNNFDGRFSVAHLQFDVKSLPGTTNAQTSPPNGFWIKIDFNSNNLNRPTLDIARTFMHEMIHAEMFHILLSLASTSNGQIDVAELTLMLNNNNYPGIYDYFRRFGLNNMQHEQMVAHYRNVIINFLKQIDSSITDTQADSMAWVGLQGTIAWNNLGIINQNNILSTYNNWKATASQACP